MATNSDQLNLDPAPEVDNPAPAAPSAQPATPTFGLEDVRNLVGETVRSTMGELISASRQNQPIPQEQEPDAPTEEEFQENLPLAIAKTVNRALHPMRQQFDQFQRFGLDRLGELTQTVTAEKLPYYKDYKSEIDQRLSTVPPTERTNPQVIKLVHDTVVASHISDITAKAVEQKIRQQSTDTPAPGSGPNGRTMPSNKSDIPAPDDLFSPEQVDEIERHGGPDRFAQKVSQGRFKTWDEYAKSSQAYNKRETGMGIRGRIIPFAKVTDKKAS